MGVDFAKRIMASRRRNAPQPGRVVDSCCEACWKCICCEGPSCPSIDCCSLPDRCLHRCCQFLCSPCTPSCGTSLIFLGFVTFYLISFLWDVFVILGGWTVLPITQQMACLERAGFSSMSSEFVLVMMFGAVFHAVSLIWIIGFVHTRDLPRSRRTDLWIRPGVPRDVPLPKEWYHPALMAPFICLDVSMMVVLGLSVYTFLFLDQLMEREPEAFVDRFCISLEDTEEAFLWMEMSLMFFAMSFAMGCIYCCLIRVATKDVSILNPGAQWDISSPRLDPRRAIDRAVVQPARAAGNWVQERLEWDDSGQESSP